MKKHHPFILAKCENDPFLMGLRIDVDRRNKRIKRYRCAALTDASFYRLRNLLQSKTRQVVEINDTIEVFWFPSREAS